MTLPERKSLVSTGTLVVAAIAVVAVVAAWQVGRRSERRAAEARRAAAAAAIEGPGPAPTVAADSAGIEEPPALRESWATYEMPLAPETPTPVSMPAQEERPADTPQRCLTLHASPSMASAYGRSGAVVQLVVRAQNGCSTGFGYASFRVVAIGADGREAGSAVGRFPGGVLAAGSAETLIAIPTTPSTSLTYRAEVR